MRKSNLYASHPSRTTDGPAQVMGWRGTSQNLTRLPNEATALRNREEFQRGQLTELANADFAAGQKRATRLRQRSPTVMRDGSEFRGMAVRRA